MNCDHKNFKINDFNRIGWGTCLDCRREVPLPDLFNGLIERTQQALKKLEEKNES